MELGTHSYSAWKCWGGVKMKELLVAILILTAAGSTDAQTTNFFDLVKTGTPQQIQAAINQGANAACFESAMRVVARMRKKPLTEASVTGHVNFSVTGSSYTARSKGFRTRRWRS